MRSLTSLLVLCLFLASLAEAKRRGRNKKSDLFQVSNNATDEKGDEGGNRQKKCMECS